MVESAVFMSGCEICLTILSMPSSLRKSDIYMMILTDCEHFMVCVGSIHAFKTFVKSGFDECTGEVISCVFLPLYFTNCLTGCIDLLLQALLRTVELQEQSRGHRVREGAEPVTGVNHHVVQKL